MVNDLNRRWYRVFSAYDVCNVSSRSLACMMLPSPAVVPGHAEAGSCTVTNHHISESLVVRRTYQVSGPDSSSSVIEQHSSDNSLSHLVDTRIASRDTTLEMLHSMSALSQPLAQITL